MAELPINYGDTGKVARDKINDSFEALETTVAGYRPHIESGIRWIGDTNTGVKAEGDSIVMKAEDGYIWYKSESNSWTKIIAIADLKGEQGEPGDDGNGIASITTTKVGKTTTVTITETDGNVDTFDILDGEDGAGGGGDVKGPASATSGDIAIFDGATGKKIKDGSVSLSTLSAGAALGATAVQPGDDISDLNNDSGFITGITSGDVTTALGYTPYNSSNPDGYTTNTGDVVGPGSSTDGHLVLFDGATGKLIKDGGAMPTIPSITTISVTLTSAGWSSSTQTVTATGVTASNTVIVSPSPSSIADYSEGGVYCSAQGTNSLTFTCYTDPSNDITVNVVILS